MTIHVQFILYIWAYQFTVKASVHASVEYLIISCCVLDLHVLYNHSLMLTSNNGLLLMMQFCIHKQAALSWYYIW